MICENAGFLNAHATTQYIDKTAVAEEVAFAKAVRQAQLADIDVTRRSIEETAAAVMNAERRRSR